MRFAPLLLEIELRDMFRLFLVVFILIGLLPFFQKFVDRVENALQLWLKARLPARPPELADVEASFERGSATEQWDGYEYLVFHKLALAGKRGLSFPALARELHLDTAHIAAALQSLGRRGLLGQAASLLPVRRFVLSRRGHQQAVSSGILLPLHKEDNQTWLPPALSDGSGEGGRKK